MTSTHEARHPVTLFTGQWADLPFDEVARRAAEWGYDGLEIAASGDHLDLRRADEDPAYLRSRLEVLDVRDNHLGATDVRERAAVLVVILRSCLARSFGYEFPHRRNH